MHDAFIGHVKHHRPGLDAPSVCTGETWLGVHAIEKGLIDQLSTSDAYLRARQVRQSRACCAAIITRSLSWALERHITDFTCM